MERSVAEILVPLVAVERNAHHPFGFSNVTNTRLRQLRNAYSPMLVTPSGIVMLVKLVQPEKAEEPMPTVFARRVTEVTVESQSTTHLST